MSKTRDELLAQPMLSGGEAYDLAQQLGHTAINKQRVSWLCREADKHGLDAEKRGPTWYIATQSWVLYLAKPRRRGRPSKIRQTGEGAMNYYEIKVQPESGHYLPAWLLAVQKIDPACEIAKLDDECSDEADVWEVQSAKNLARAFSKKNGVISWEAK